MEVIDHVGNATTAWSANPFYIVSPNPDSVNTLILHNVQRMVDLGAEGRDFADGTEVLVTVEDRTSLGPVAGVSG